MKSLFIPTFAVNVFGYNISAKFIGGLALGLALVYLAYRVIMAMTANREGESGAEKKETVTWSLVKFGIGFAIVTLLERSNIISFTDITAAMSQAQ
jgi:hypothetical protein